MMPADGHLPRIEREVGMPGLAEALAGQRSVTVRVTIATSAGVTATRRVTLSQRRGS